MKKILAISFLLCGIAQTQAAPFPDGNPKTGKKLFDQYKCNSCHIGKMGGDGSTIFTRPDHKATSPQLITERIKMCSGAIGSSLSAQEEAHLSAYLNQRYYKFK